MWWLLFACARPVPPALAPEPAPAVAPEPTDPAALFPWMVGRDPLLRRPRLPASDPADPALAAFVALARMDEPPLSGWWGLEEQFPGTVAVPLARGARLAAMEAAGEDPAGVLDALLPFGPPNPAVERTRSPMSWANVVSPRDLLVAGERAVLLGWLADPVIDRAPAARLLGEPDWERLAVTPAGRLLLAREGVESAARVEVGRRALADATGYALLRAAADRSTEVAAVTERKIALAAAWGVEGDPLATVLAAARSAFGEAGGSAATGLGLVALTAERLGRSCPDAPCAGFDRVATLGAAARWGAEAAVWAELWRLIALKNARDHVEVAWNEPSFPSALDGLVDALVGLGAGPFDRSVLHHARPGPGVALAVVRALGEADATSREALLGAVDRRLARQAALVEDALVVAGPTLSPEAGTVWKEAAQRIRRRAERGPSPPAGAPSPPAPR